MKYRAFVVSLLLCVMVSACGGGGGGPSGGGGGGNGGSAQTDAQLLADFNQMFPFNPTGARAEIFICAFNIAPAGLPGDGANEFFLELDGSAVTGAFSVHYTLDFISNTSVQSSTPGSFSFQNGMLTLTSNDPLFGQIFIPRLTFNETSTLLDTQMGLISHFETPLFECYIAGHQYNDPVVEFPQRYDCPIFNTLGYDEHNVFELVHVNFPATTSRAGSAFRSIEKVSFTQPRVFQGYGIYRRINGDVYLYFPRPNSRFSDEDRNVIQGNIAAYGPPVNTDGLVSDDINLAPGSVCRLTP